MKTNEERRQRIIAVLSEVLERLCERNDRFIDESTMITRFHALRPPSIGIKYYLQRIAKYSNCSEECFVLALIFIDRLIRTNENFLVNSLNVHRLVITAVMTGAKFFDDQYFNNSYYGKIGGVSCKEINLLEVEFLFMLNFNLFVTSQEYETYNHRLMYHKNTPSRRANPSQEEESVPQAAPKPAATTAASNPGAGGSRRAAEASHPWHNTGGGGSNKESGFQMRAPSVGMRCSPVVRGRVHNDQSLPAC